MAGAEPRRLARGLAALSCALLALAALPGAAAAPLPLTGCRRLVLSPGYAKDGTAFCAGVFQRETVLRLYVTHNHARTWSRVDTTGIVVTSGMPLRDFAVSPAFANDGMLVVQMGGDLYVSTDEGATFRQVPLLQGRITLDTSVAALPGAASLAHGVIVGAGGGADNHSYVFDPVVPALRAVAGTGGTDVAFFLPPARGATGEAFAVGVAPGATTLRHTVYACDATYTCGSARWSFPAGEFVDQMWFAADYATSGVLFVTTIGSRLHLYVSRDRGATFAAVPALRTALDQSYRAGAAPALVLTPGRAGSRTVFARVSAGTERPEPPSERLYRSDDDGRTWRLVSYGRSVYARGPRGTMPYSYTYHSSAGEPTPTGLLTYAPDGRLLMVGIKGATHVVWCSADGGRSWRTTCP
jgi:hypothetical protein